MKDSVQYIKIKILWADIKIPYFMSILEAAKKAKKWILLKSLQ